MKFLSTLALLLAVNLAFGQNGNNGNTSNNGRENWFPSHGKVGVGTRFPTADLEVVGDVLSSGRISAQDINSNNFTGSSLLLSNNAVVNGRIGIGISTPTEALDVVGNFRLQGNFSAQQVTFQGLTSANAQLSSLNVSGNSTFNGSSIFSQASSFGNNILVSGKIGIGVASPVESLDVLGNFRLQGNIAAQQATFSSLTSSGAALLNSLQVAGQSLFNGSASFSGNVSLSNNLFVNGKIGIGIASPTEAFETSGNIKSAGIISGSGQLASLEVTDNTIVNGSVGIGTSTPEQKLHVAGSMKVNEAITASAVHAADLSAEHFRTTENSTFEKNVVVNEKLAVGLPSATESLDVNGNGKFSGSLTATTVNSSSANFSNGLQAGNATINGSLSVSGPFTAQAISMSDITATNNVSVSNNLNVGGASAFTGDLEVHGASTLNSLSVSGQSELQSVNATGLAVSQNASVGQNLTVQGNLAVAGSFTTGSMSVAEVNSVGNISTSQNLLVTGTSQFTGQADFGTVHAGIIEATEFRTTGGGSPFNFENARISQTLGIATLNNNVPANYKLAVGGNIIATGIDIKIPEKWPDYVFTDGYRLLTIEEVDAFIRKHGHLPGVLSAGQMEKAKNYSVSEMDAKLMEKVEELTLYIIELKKEIEALKKKSN
ncbi:MAG TPA: hypothetical protein VGD65_21535 [Chryseosolibacter sp.]